jgi:hypothetical protein
MRKLNREGDKFFSRKIPANQVLTSIKNYFREKWPHSVNQYAVYSELDNKLYFE